MPKSCIHLEQDLKLNWLKINNKPKGKTKVCKKAKVREGEVLNSSNQLLGFAVLPPNSPARVHAVKLTLNLDLQTTGV